MKRVALGVYLRPGGTYAASVSVNDQTHKASFGTLEEAVSWREGLKKTRTAPRKWSKAGIKNFQISTWTPQDTLDEEEVIKQQIAAAPREKRGEFTVVKLPDAPHIPTKWKDLASIKELTRNAA